MEQAMNNMPDLKNLAGMTEQQLTTALSLGTPLLEGLSNLCRQQAGFLQRLEAATVEALERQRAGCTAMQELIERLRAARNPSDVLAAQQEWLGGAMQRAIADVACCQSAGLGWVNEVGRQWQAPQSASARAAGRPAKPSA
jgi:hypothetical protein